MMITVELCFGDLKRHVYKFWASYPEMLFDHYEEQDRKSKRHKFKTTASWDRSVRPYRSAPASLKQPPTVPSVVMTNLRYQILDNLHFPFQHETPKPL